MGLGAAGKRIHIDKLAGTRVFDPIGDQAGKTHGAAATFRVGGMGNVIGLVVEAGPCRKVFFPLTRIISIEAGSVVTTGSFNIRSFTQCPVETLILAELFDRIVTLNNGPGEVRILDVAVEHRRPKDWVISKLYVQRQHIIALGFTRLGEILSVGVSEVSGLLRVGTNQAATSLIAQAEDMHPADLADYLHDPPIERQIAITQQLPGARLADVLEELGGDGRVAIVSSLEANRATDVLDVMQPGDAVDLVSEPPGAQAQALLFLTEPEEARDVRRLLPYAESTAGSFMTTDSVIFGPDATVAQMLASAQREDPPVSLTIVTSIARPPERVPTGPCLRMAHIQHAPREPPQILFGMILGSDIKTVLPQVHIAAVTHLLTTYNLTVLPVVDEDFRLLGVVSVDDLLDKLLSKDWRDYNGEVTDHVVARDIDGRSSRHSARTRLAFLSPPQDLNRWFWSFR